MRVEWEYSVKEFKTIDAGGMTQSLNGVGDGWELVAVVPPLHYFKRRKAEAYVSGKSVFADAIQAGIDKPKEDE